jgi:hypothetical protein
LILVRSTSTHLSKLLLALCLLLLTGCGPGPGWSRSRVAVEQGKAEVLSAHINDSVAVGQHFRLPEGELSVIEVLLVVPVGAPELPTRPLRWEVRNELAAVVRQGTIETAGMLHNTPLRIEFEPIAVRAGSEWEVQFFGPDNAQLAFWASRNDALNEGWQTQSGAAQSNDLWFKAHLVTTPLTVWRTLPRLADRWGLGLLWVLLILFGPGLLLVGWLGPRAQHDAFAPAILAIGLSLAIIPLVYLWVSPLGLMITHDLARSLLQASLVGALLLALRQPEPMRQWLGAVRRSFPMILFVMVLLLAASASRLQAITGYPLPLWVDSVHHTMIVALFEQQGMLPVTYRPFLPLDTFTYHFGFHAQAALLAEASRLPSYEAVLLWGQVLNLAALPALFLLAQRLARPLAAYLATPVVLSPPHAPVGDDHPTSVAPAPASPVFISAPYSPAPGVLAAGLVALVLPLLALMPAYFVTWGRYTQLLGLVLMAIALESALVWLWSSERHWGQLATAAVLGAGLVVSHYRALIFYAIAIALALLVAPLTRDADRAESAGRSWLHAIGRVALLTLTVVLLSLPWLWRIGNQVIAPLASAGLLLGGAESYNTVPVRFLTMDITPWLLGLALAGTLLALAWRLRSALLLLLWVSLVVLLANGTQLLGLAPFWLVNNESLVISYWVPAGLGLGLGAGVVAAMFRRVLPPLAATLLLGLLSLPVVAVGLYGAWWRSDVINPVTVLATNEDLEAAQWIESSLPTNATFLINSRFWQGNLYAGTDGGYWLPILARRQTTLPPVHYFYTDQATQDAINRLAETIANTDNLDDPALRAELRQRGITHIYLGAQGGKLDLEKLRALTVLREIYNRGRVHIFELLPEESFP